MQLWVWGFSKPVIGFTGGPGGQNPWKICNIWLKASMIHPFGNNKTKTVCYI